MPEGRFLYAVFIKRPVLSISISYARPRKYPPACNVAVRPLISIKAKGAGLASTGPDKDRKEQPMLDLMMLAVGLGFFAIALAYVAGCERL
jgi:hypothetical protein